MHTHITAFSFENKGSHSLIILVVLEDYSIWGSISLKLHTKVLMWLFVRCSSESKHTASKDKYIFKTNWNTMNTFYVAYYYRWLHLYSFYTLHLFVMCSVHAWLPRFTGRTLCSFWWGRLTADWNGNLIISLYVIITFKFNYFLTFLFQSALSLTNRTLLMVLKVKRENNMCI